MLPFQYPVRSAVLDPCIVPVEVTVSGTLGSGGTVAVTNAEALALGCSASFDATGKFTINVPSSDGIRILGKGVIVGTDHSGSDVYVESKTPSTGAITIETAITPGTAANPPSGAIIFLTVLLKTL
jgi:hypothetical protein